MIGLWLTRDPLGELTGNDGLLNQARTLGFSVAQAATNNGPIATGGATGQLSHLTGVLADALLRAPAAALELRDHRRLHRQLRPRLVGGHHERRAGRTRHTPCNPAVPPKPCTTPRPSTAACSPSASGSVLLGLVFAVFVLYITYSYIMVCGAALLNAVMAIFAVGTGDDPRCTPPTRAARRRLEQFFRHAFLVFVYVLYTCIAAMLILKTVAPGGLASQVGMTSPVAMLVLVALWSAVATGLSSGTSNAQIPARPHPPGPHPFRPTGRSSAGRTAGTSAAKPRRPRGATSPTRPVERFSRTSELRRRRTPVVTHTPTPRSPDGPAAGQPGLEHDEARPTQRRQADRIEPAHRPDAPRAAGGAFGGATAGAAGAAEAGAAVLAPEGRAACRRGNGQRRLQRRAGTTTTSGIVRATQPSQRRRTATGAYARTTTGAPPHADAATAASVRRQCRGASASCPAANQSRGSRGPQGPPGAPARPQTRTAPDPVPGRNPR